MARSLTPEELCTLVDRYFSTLVLFARRWTDEGAEDLVQDAFLRLVKRSRWEGLPDQPVAWLFRVVRNGATDRYRKEKRRQKHEEASVAERSIHFESPLESAFQEKEVADMLDKLEPRQRDILVSRIWGGLTFDEIADLTETSRTTVFRLYTEALETIRKHYGKE